MSATYNPPVITPEVAAYRKYVASLGGKARAKKLTKKERVRSATIASHAAVAAKLARAKAEL